MLLGHINPSRGGQEGQTDAQMSDETHEKLLRSENM
jgi:hypothetical protein